VQNKTYTKNDGENNNLKWEIKRKLIEKLETRHFKRGTIFLSMDWKSETFIFIILTKLKTF
jgi:hypothetical protein